MCVEPCGETRYSLTTHMWQTHIHPIIFPLSVGVDSNRQRKNVLTCGNWQLKKNLLIQLALLSFTLFTSSYSKLRVYLWRTLSFYVWNRTVRHTAAWHPALLYVSSPVFPMTSILWRSRILTSKTLAFSQRKKIGRWGIRSTKQL